MERSTPPRSGGSDLREILRVGGLTLPPAGSDEPITGTYNGLLDPPGAEVLGSLLADVLAEHDPGGVLIWQDPHDLVLGYLVSRRLGVSGVRTYDADGLVGFDGPFPPGERMVLVSGAFRTPEAVRAMCALVRQQSRTVVAAASLVAPPTVVTEEFESQDVPHLVLTDATDDTDGAGDV